MSEREGLAEAVLLFEPDGNAITQEMRLVEFESLVTGAATLDEFAASVVKAAYVVVGNALAVQGIAFFTFRVDEDGRIDPAFNLPLRYLVDNAGKGPDLGSGKIRLACRGQCPVPWHSVNLWQPLLDGEQGAPVRVQKAIWRNRLGLKATGRLEEASDELELDENHANGATRVEPGRPEPPLEPSRATPAPTPLPSRPEPRRAAPHRIDARPGGWQPEPRELEARLTETFGQEGKVSVQNLIRQHNDQLSRVSERYRSDLERQQQMYLDQIRGCRDEIQRLKSALRQEQDRSRRLQQLLRGEP